MALREIEIPASLVDAYRQDGAVCVRGAFDDASIDLLRDGVERNISAPGPLHTVQQGGEDPGFFLTDFCMAQRLAEFRTFIFESAAAGIAAHFMGASRVSFFYDAMWVKGTATPKRTRWHQDQPYYPVDGSQFCAIWIPLDPVAADTCLELLRGSHRWGRTFRPMRFNGTDLFADDTSERVPDISARRADFDLAAWEMEAGDAVAFSFLTLHGAPGNVSHTVRRRAFTARFVGDDAVFRDLGGLGSPPFRDLALEDGEPLSGPEFPVVFPRPSGVNRAGNFGDCLV